MKVFQPFRLDIVNQCLWRADKRVDLTPKAFDVLRYLVEHSDRLVTQDEILEALWPGTYVNPEVVKKYVLEIRKALGDQPQNPAFVATFPRRGYQFIATVSDEISSSISHRVEKSVTNIVGRSDASVQLDDSLNRALDGRRQVIFITGEAGIGKTSLLDLFEQRAVSKPRLRIARGQCVEGFGGKEAYYPVLEALGQWFRAADAGPAVSTLAKQAPTWLIQFPSLVKADQRSALQKEILGATRERMVREICEALELLTAEDPLVLILEDLHWVDPSTVDFISALARRRGPAKLLLLGTYRPAEVILSQSPLKALKQDLVLHNQCHEIALERLENSDVAEYIKVKFHATTLPAEFAGLIYRHSGGNPLFMATILQDMVKKRLLVQADGNWTLAVPLDEVDPSVPDTLDQLIESQFQQLSATEQRILKSASVAGERFSAWTIATAAQVDPAILEDTCERLAEKLQFIRPAGIHELPNGQISARYDFRHSLYREVLYRRLSENARSKLHLILAQRLQTFCDPGASTQMLAAGCRLVFDTWGPADAQLCSSSYETLLRLHPSELDTYKRLAYAHVAILKGHYAEALDLTDSSVAEASASPVGQVANFLAHFGALSARSISLMHMGQLGKVLELTQAARATPDENLACYWQMSFREAWLRTIAFDFEGARRICHETGQLGGDHPIAYGQTVDQIAAGCVALYAGDYSQAIALFRNVHEPPVLTKFFLHWWLRLIARFEWSNACLMSGDFLGARVAADGFVEPALSSADPYLQTLAWDLSTRLAMAESDLQRARESIQHGLAVVEKCEVLVAAWRVYSTAWQLMERLTEHKTAEAHRQRAESCILKIAGSFHADEPLRAKFLHAEPIRQILREKTVSSQKRPRTVRGHAAP